MFIRVCVAIGSKVNNLRISKSSRPPPPSSSSEAEESSEEGSEGEDVSRSRPRGDTDLDSPDPDAMYVDEVPAVQVNREVIGEYGRGGDGDDDGDDVNDDETGDDDSKFSDCFRSIFVGD